MKNLFRENFYITFCSQQAEPARTSRNSSKKSFRFALHSSRVRWLSSHENSLLSESLFFHYGFPILILLTQGLPLMPGRALTFATRRK